MQKLLQDVDFGKNLQRLRKSRNLSQYDMVAKIRNVYISDLILFKEILKVDYADFFEPLTYN